MLAFIPTVGRSPLLRPLVERLLEEGAEVYVLDAGVEPCRFVADGLRHPRFRAQHSPGMGIYPSWNLGIDLGCSEGHRPCSS